MTTALTVIIVPDLLLLGLLPAGPIPPDDVRKLLYEFEATVVAYDPSVAAPLKPVMGPQIGTVTDVIAKPDLGACPAPANIHFTSATFTKGAIIQHLTETRAAPRLGSE